MRNSTSKKIGLSVYENTEYYIDIVNYDIYVNSKQKQKDIDIPQLTAFSGVLASLLGVFFKNGSITSNRQDNLLTIFIIFLVTLFGMLILFLIGTIRIKNLNLHNNLIKAKMKSNLKNEILKAAYEKTKPGYILLGCSVIFTIILSCAFIYFPNIIILIFLGVCTVINVLFGGLFPQTIQKMLLLKKMKKENLF